MGKIKRFEIVLENANGVVYAGQQVRGRVEVELSEAAKVKGIRIRFTGDCSVEFEDAQKSGKRHAARQQYFEQVDVLFGNPDSSIIDGGQALEAGAHSYPFVFASPAHLPSSFEHKQGRVRYLAKAYLSRRLALDWSSKKAFSVVSLVNLNSRPEAFQPAFVETERRFSLSDRLLCCTSGGLSVQVKIPRSAFVPGESLPISAEVSNSSSLRVKKVKAYLHQNIIFTASTGSRFYKGEEMIGLLTQGEVKSGQTQYWQNEALKLPPLPPTNLGCCKFINVSYLLYFVVEVASAEDVTLTLPVIIGTVPLRTTPANPPPYAPQRPPPPTLSPLKMPLAEQLTNGGPSSSATVPSAPPMETGSPFFPTAGGASPSPSAPPYVGPPPSYQECVFMERGNLADGEEAEGGGGDATYRPLYPTYALT